MNTKTVTTNNDYETMKKNAEPKVKRVNDIVEDLGLPYGIGINIEWNGDKEIIIDMMMPEVVILTTMVGMNARKETIRKNLAELVDNFGDGEEWYKENKEYLTETLGECYDEFQLIGKVYKDSEIVNQASYALQ